MNKKELDESLKTTTDRINTILDNKIKVLNEENKKNDNLNKIGVVCAMASVLLAGLSFWWVYDFSNNFQRKFLPIEISYSELQQNKIFLSFDKLDEDDYVKQIHKRTSNNNQMYYRVAEKLQKDVELENKKGKNLAFYIMVEPYFDILGNITTKSSGDIKSLKLATKDMILEGYFNIIEKPKDNVFLVLDLHTGLHEVITSTRANQWNKKQSQDSQINISPTKSMMGLLFQEYPKNKMIHAIYTDFNGNKTILTYIVYDCNCIQREQATTDVRSFMLIALRDSDISNKVILQKVYKNLTTKISNNQKFDYQRLDNHEIKYENKVLTEKRIPENWKVAELESLETFRKVIIEERKSLIKFLQEIGE